MLKRINRLKARGDFKRTLAGRRLCINDCFVLYGLTSLPASAGSFGISEPRIGFIVSKKIHKRSVQRNRIKRRLRELARTYLMTEKRKILTRFRTLVFIASGGSLNATYQDLQRKMERCFQILEKTEN